MKKIMAALLFIIGIFYMLLTSETGLQLAYKLSRYLIPGKLHITQLHGSLLGSISFEEMNYTNPEVQLTIKSLSLDWKIKEIFKTRFAVNKLSVSQVDILIPGNTAASTDTSYSEVLKTYLWFVKLIEVTEANVNNLTVSQGENQLFKLNNLTIYPRSGEVRRILFDSSLLKINGSYQLHYQPQFSWKVKFEKSQIDLKDISSDLRGKIDFSIASQGVWSKRYKQFQIDLQDVSGKINQYALNANIKLLLNKEALHFQQFNLHFADARLNISGALGGNERAHWNLNIPQLYQVIPGLGGEIFSEGDLAFKNNKPTILASIQASKLSYEGLKLHQINARISGAYTGGVDSELTITLDNDNALSGTLSFPHFNLQNPAAQQVSLKGLVAFSNLARLNYVFASYPQIQSLKGQLTGDINISGSLFDPHVQANLDLNQGSLFVPPAGMQFENISLRASYRNNEPLQFNSHFTLGRGNANLKGEIEFIDKIAADLFLNGENLLIANTDEYRLIISPDINILYQDHNVKVNGEVSVPEAKISPVDFSTVTTLPGDVVIVNHKEEKNLLDEVGLSVRVSLGDKVYLDFFNLKARLKGSLLIMQNPGNPPTASGDLNAVDGTYKAYGKNLIIEQGRLFYAGNLLFNPGVDLRAYQNVKTLSYNDQFESLSSASTGKLAVGIVVRGTLSKPKLSFYSNPAGLSQGDILSYLILGHPQSEASAGSATALLGIASGMSGSNAGDFTSSIQDKLGLDELGVGSTEHLNSAGGERQTSTTVNVGRHLGKDFSLHYSVGIFDPVSILSLRYKINKYFAIQTETSSVESGGDILYHIESDQ